MATMEVNSRSDTFISLDCSGNLPSSVLSFVCVSLICLISISRNPQVKTHRSWTEIENCAGFIKTLGSTLALPLVGMCVEKWIPVSSTAIFHNVLQLRNSLFAAPCAVSFFIILKSRFQSMPVLPPTPNFGSKDNRRVGWKSVFELSHKGLHMAFALSPLAPPPSSPCCPHHCSSSFGFFSIPSALGLHMLTSLSLF